MTYQEAECIVLAGGAARLPSWTGDAELRYLKGRVSPYRENGRQECRWSYEAGDKQRTDWIITAYPLGPEYCD